MNFFQNNKHQSNGKHEKIIPSKPMTQLFNQQQDKKCNLCPKRDYKSREEQMKIFH